MSHDQFGKIPQSPELQQRILQAELDTVEENLEVLRQQGKNVSRAMLKGLEKRKHNLEAKLEKVEHAIKSRTDDVVDFKQMGIDHIFIDESHYQNFLIFFVWHSKYIEIQHLFYIISSDYFYGRNMQGIEYILYQFGDKAVMFVFAQ